MNNWGSQCDQCSLFITANHKQKSKLASSEIFAKLYIYTVYFVFFELFCTPMTILMDL